MLPAFCWPSNSWRDQTTASAPLPQILDYGFRSVQSVHAAAPANLKLSNHHYASSSLDAIWHKGEFRQHVHYLLDSLDSQALGPQIMQCPAQDMGSMVLDSAASNYILAPRFVSQRELACHCPIQMLSVPAAQKWDWKHLILPRWKRSACRKLGWKEQLSDR